jgi:hypothetical protein
MSTKNSAAVEVTKVAPGVTGKAHAKAKKGAKAAEPEVEFDARAWEGVTMTEGKTYYVVRSRSEIEGITDLDVVENPAEVVEARFISYSVKGKEYAMDDGRLLKDMVYLAITVADREKFIYPNTPAGKKLALAYAADEREAYGEWAAAARQKDDAKVIEAATEAETLVELEVMIRALGGSPADLVKAGKARERKVVAIMKQREVWKAAKAKGADKPSEGTAAKKSSAILKK